MSRSVRARPCEPTRGLRGDELLPQTGKASTMEAVVFVVHRGPVANRTDEWRFCSSPKTFAWLPILSEAATRIALSWVYYCH